jgi:putative lysine transport system substrate-binding protein
MYVHAHLRFVEAMAKLGDGEEAWESLLKVNPILRREAVPNALHSQSNCYFSSSDACFDDRYIAMERFDMLRGGRVDVKTGWRIYSSGSGLYFGRLIGEILGLRRQGGEIVLDPVIGARFDGLELKCVIDGKNITIKYSMQADYALSVNGSELHAEQINDNVYRTAGFVFPSDLLNDGDVLAIRLL